MTTFPALRDAQSKYGERARQLHEIFEQAGAEMDLDKVTCIKGTRDEKIDEIRKINEELPELKGEVERLRDVADAADEAKKSFYEGASERGDGLLVPAGRKSFGHRFTDSVAYKGYQKGMEVGPVAHLDIDLKADFLTTAGWDPEDTRTGHLQLSAQRPDQLVVNYFPSTTTGQSTVLYMEETTYTNNAAETAEAGAYPEAELALTEKSSEVRKISTFLPVSDEQFEDEPRVADYINNRLLYMLRQRLDSQLLVGNGTAPNLRGTENVSGINTQALGADSIPDAIYKGMRVIRDTAFSEPSVVFIRPSKWESVRLLKSADGQYIWGHPSVAGVMTIWGVPVVETTAVTATKAVIGDYRVHSELALRRGIDVQRTNSHASYFTTGKQAIRADLRCALIHYRPAAFTAVTGL